MSNPTELVRVKDPSTGAKWSASRQYAKDAHLQVLENEDAVDKWGRVIPPKLVPPQLARVTADSTVAEIEAAAQGAGVDLAGAKTKADKLAALEAAAAVEPTPSTSTSTIDTTLEA